MIRRITGFRRTGHIYGEFEKRPLYEYRCTILPNSPHLDGVSDGCCHFECRLQSLREAGYADVADQLQRNASALDWLRNWGKLLYDPDRHGRNQERRNAAAAILRGMRQSKIGYADAVRTGAWAGAVM